MRTNQKKFYMVMSDESRTTVSYRHGTSVSAVKEAMRLAKQENKPFYVLQTFALVTPKILIDSVQDARPTVESEKAAIVEEIERNQIPF